MTTNKNIVSQAVCDLRHAYEESQQAFAYRTKSAIRTIARYETVRPPRGAELGQFLELAIANGRTDLAEIFGKAMADELNMKAERIPPTIEENIYADLLFLMMRNRQHSPKVADRLLETSKHLVEAYEVLKRRFRAGARVDGIDAEDRRDSRRWGCGTEAESRTGGFQMKRIAYKRSTLRKIIWARSMLGRKSEAVETAAEKQGKRQAQRTFAYVCTKRDEKLEVTENKRAYLVGPPGFEPGTSCTPSKKYQLLTEGLY